MKFKFYLSTFYFVAQSKRLQDCLYSKNSYLIRKLKEWVFTHVLQCSNRRAKLLEEERVVDLSTAKVDDLDDVHVSDNDILWFDVQVENTSGMEVVQTLEDLSNVSHHIVL